MEKKNGGKMDFKIDGKPTKISFGYDPARLKKHLESLKDGEFLSMDNLAAKFGCDKSYLSQIIRTKLPENHTLIKNITYAGSSKTIEAYKALQ